MKDNLLMLIKLIVIKIDGYFDSMKTLVMCMILMPFYLFWKSTFNNTTIERFTDENNVQLLPPKVRPLATCFLCFLLSLFFNPLFYLIFYFYNLFRFVVNLTFFAPPMFSFVTSRTTTTWSTMAESPGNPIMSIFRQLPFFIRLISSICAPLFLSQKQL